MLRKAENHPVHAEELAATPYLLGGPFVFFFHGQGPLHHSWQEQFNEGRVYLG